MHSTIFYTLLMALLPKLLQGSDIQAIIHPITLENDTVVEYRNLPLVGKCCGVDEMLGRNEKGQTVCVSLNISSTVFFSPLFSEYNRTGVLVPGNERKEFDAIVGDPCRYKRYALDPEHDGDDVYYLMLNGSVFAPHHIPRMLMPAKDYCMDVVEDSGLKILVCFPKDLEIVTADSRITIYASGLLISVPFLILTIAAYTITPKLRNVHGKALCHYCGCLAVAFTTLAIVQLASSSLSNQVCTCIAFIVQFSFVACFFWLNVMCIETWSLVRCHVKRGTYIRTEPKRLFFYYSIWGWGPPAILIIVSMVMELSPTIPSTYVKPTFGSERCWFKSDAQAMPYFYVPVGLLLLANLILFIITAIRVTRYQKDLELRRLASDLEFHRRDQRLFGRLKRTFYVCVGVFFLMGLNWSMELISWGVGGDPMEWSAFDLVNALQGVLVFGLFVLRRPPRDYVQYRIQQIRGLAPVEPQAGRMDMNLLP